MTRALGFNALTTIGSFANKSQRCPALLSRWNTGTSNGSSDFGGTGRQAFVMPFAMHDFQAVFWNGYDSGGGELSLPFSLAVQATLEYPANTFYKLFVNGQSPFYLAPGARVFTDLVGVSIPAGATAYVRTFINTAKTPTLNSVTTSTTGGSLSAGNWYYQVTAVCGAGGLCGESVPTAAQFVTSTGSTSSNTLTITAPSTVSTSAAWDASAAPSYYNIYRSYNATTYLLTTIPVQPNVTTWTDTFGSNSNVAPLIKVYSATTLPQFPIGPSGMGQTVTAGPAPPSGQGCNYISYSGNAENQTATSGTSWISTTTGQFFGALALIGTPDGGYDVPVALGYGDSIMGGTGDIPDRGFIFGALTSGNTPYIMCSKYGEYAWSMIAPYWPQRIQYASGVSDILDELGTNDINVYGFQVIAVQTNAINRWIEMRKRGPAGSILPRIWAMTLLPRVATSDSLTTYANQEPGGMNVSTATNATPIVVTATTTYSGTIMGFPVTTCPSGASSSATTMVVAANVGILAGMAFQVSGANYVVTAASGTTITFTPALAASISAAATIIFGTTTSTGAAIGATSMTVGFTCNPSPASPPYPSQYQGTTSNCTLMPNQTFVVGGTTYTVTLVNYTTGVVTFTPAIATTALAASAFVQFLTPLTIRGCGGNTAANGTFFVSCNGNQFTLYSDTAYQSPVAGNGTYTAGTGLIERPICETNRQSYNAWVRAGCPVTITGTAAQQAAWSATYVPVAPGTGGAVTVGQPGHPAYSTFDAGGAVEYNSSGSLTVGGNYWRTNAAAFYYSIDGIHPTQNSYPALAATVPVSAIVAP